MGANAKERLDRTKPQFYNIYELDWDKDSSIRVFQDLDVRLLSRDDDSNSTTAMIRLPQDWKIRYDSAEATAEFFVLQGSLTCNGERAGVGSYVYIPQASGDYDIEGTADTHAYFFWNPGIDVSQITADGLCIRHLTKEPWNQSVMPDTMHGVSHKSLRLPDENGVELHGGPQGMIRFTAHLPQYQDTREHVHEIWEEMFFFNGDMLMPPRGVISRGTYLGNPAGFWHAPMLCQTGIFHLLHTLDKIGQVAREYEGGDELAARYFASTSLLQQQTHQPWDNLPTSVLGS